MPVVVLCFKSGVIPSIVVTGLSQWLSINFNRSLHFNGFKASTSLIPIFSPTCLLHFLRGLPRLLFILRIAVIVVKILLLLRTWQNCISERRHTYWYGNWNTWSSQSHCHLRKPRWCDFFKNIVQQLIAFSLCCFGLGTLIIKILVYFTSSNGFHKLRLLCIFKSALIADQLNGFSVSLGRKPVFDPREFTRSACRAIVHI